MRLRYFISIQSVVSYFNLVVINLETYVTEFISYWKKSTPSIKSAVFFIVFIIKILFDFCHTEFVQDTIYYI